MATQQVEQDVLCHPIVDLVTDPQRFCEEWLCLIEARVQQRGATQVDQQHLQTVGVTCLSAETHAF